MWKDKVSSERADVRLLGDHRDRAGRRRLPLSDAVALMRSSDIPDFGLEGPRALAELFQSVSEGPGSFATYHVEFLRFSGLREGATIAHAHRILCEVFRFMHSVDQLDASNLASAEQLVRWRIQMEVAVSRNPKHPDFPGLDIILVAPTSKEGVARVPKMTEWIKSRMAERAAIWKQERLFREDRADEAVRHFRCRRLSGRRRLRRQLRRRQRRRREQRRRQLQQE